MNAKWFLVVLILIALYGFIFQLTCVIVEAVKELVGSAGRSERSVPPAPGAGHLHLVNGDGLGLEPRAVVFPPARSRTGAGG